jgi:hypothetical protein
MKIFVLYQNQTRMKKVLSSLLAAAVLLLTSCSKSEDAVPNTSAGRASGTYQGEFTISSGGNATAGSVSISIINDNKVKVTPSVSNLPAYEISVKDETINGITTIVDNGDPTISLSIGSITFAGNTVKTIFLQTPAYSFTTR